MILRSIDAIIQMLDADYIENNDIEQKVMGVCIDSRKVIEGNLFIPIKGDKFNGHHYVSQAIANGAIATLWNKNEPNPPKEITVILVEDTVEGLQKLAAVYRSQLAIKIVGITGSNGKTSTKDILAAILSKRYITQKTLGNFNNEIGVPLTLLSISEHTQIAVVEMGMENLEELDLLTHLVKPDIAIITNVGTAHLENLKTLENIAKAKMEIVHGLHPNGLFIYYGDQKVLQDAVIKEQIKGSIRIKTFGEQSHNDIFIESVSQNENGLQFTINGNKVVFKMDMLGKHQVVNALSAIIAAKELGVQEEEIQQGLLHIEKTGMRNELIYIEQSTILNDAYKSNPQSVIAALDTMEFFNIPYKLAVLGDMLDLGPESDMIHFDLGKKLASYKLDEILTFGDMARYITQGANQVMKDVNVRHFIDKQELVEYLKPYRLRKCMILVKGSRGLQMDQIIESLKEV